MPRKLYKKLYNKRAKSMKAMKKLASMRKMASLYKTGSRYGRARVPNSILRYVSMGAYGQEAKTMDMRFGTVYPLAGVWIVDNVQPWNALPMNSTAVVQALNLVQQGAGIPNRIGNKISMKYIRLRLQTIPTGNGNVPATNQQQYRMMVIYDRQASNSANYPGANVILQDMFSTNTETTGVWNSGISVNQLERYTVLLDDILTLPGLTITAPAYQEGQVGPMENKNFCIDKYIPLKDLETVYNTTQSPPVVGNIVTGALYLLVWGNLPNFTEPWMLTGTARLRFHDN